MRILLLIALIFSTFAAHATDVVTAIITVTNTPSNGNTLTVNGNVRTWKTSVSAIGTDILIASGIGPTATNLYNHVASYGFSGPLQLTRSSTNAITLKGIPAQSMTVSASGSWATITYATNTVTDTYAVRVPITSEPTATQRTNIASLLLVSLRDYPTNSLTLTTATTNFLDTTTAQVVSNKTLSTGTYIKAGTITNTAAEQITFKYRSSADIGADGYNGIYFTKNAGGDPWIIAPDSAGKPSLYNANATNPPVLAADYTPNPQNLLNLLIASNTFGGKAHANSWTGTNTFTRITNSTIVGSTLSQISDINGYVTALTNGYWLSGGLTNGALTNTTVYGTFYTSGKTSFERVANTALASGPNADVDFGSGTFVEITSGPSANFTISGISGGVNGRLLIVHNATSYSMGILNDTGTAANRILTGTGGDVYFSGSATVSLIYDSNQSKWILAGVSEAPTQHASPNTFWAGPASGSATNATFRAIDLSTDVTGILPITNLPGSYGTNYNFDTTQISVSSLTNVTIISGATLTNTVLRGSTSGSFTVGSTGNLTADTARTITTSTGALTLGTGGGNANLVLAPHGTGMISLDTESAYSKGGSYQTKWIGTLAAAATATNAIGINAGDATSAAYGAGIVMYPAAHGSYPGSLYLGYAGSGQIKFGNGGIGRATGTERATLDGVKFANLLRTDSTSSITGSEVIGDGSTTALNVGIGEGNVNIGTGLAVGSTITIGGSTTTGGAVKTARKLIKSVTAFTDATPKDLVTVTIPNGAHSAVVTIQILGSIGAGGAIGANEASASVSYTFTLARRAGIATVVNASSVYGSSQASVAGGTSITITAAASSITGAVGVTQSFTIQGTITKGSGSSDNHTAVVIAEVMNANASGVTIQ